MEWNYYIVNFDLNDVTVSQLAQVAFLKKAAWGWDESLQCLHIRSSKEKGVIRTAVSTNLPKLGITNCKVIVSSAAESEGMLQHFPNSNPTSGSHSIPFHSIPFHSIF